MSALKREPFWYLATPYRNYKAGLKSASIEAAKATAFLAERDIRVFCPIVHGQPLVDHGGLDPVDSSLWLAIDRPFLEAAVGLIVIKMQGWDESIGVADEILKFRASKKPVLYMEWED